MKTFRWLRYPTFDLIFKYKTKKTSTYTNFKFAHIAILFYSVYNAIWLCYLSIRLSLTDCCQFPNNRSSAIYEHNERRCYQSFFWFKRGSSRNCRIVLKGYMIPSNFDATCSLARWWRVWKICLYTCCWGEQMHMKR